MDDFKDRPLWPQAFSHKSIISTYLVILLLNLFYIKYYTPIPLLICILFTTIFFFESLYYFSVKWVKMDEIVFYRKLFWNSILIRILFLFIVYILTVIYDRNSLPLEMFADDAKRYLNSGYTLANNMFNGKFIKILPQQWKNQADWGFPTYLGFINSILPKSVLIVKFINIVWGSLTVVLLAKISSMLYTRRHAMLTGILAMLFPSLIWYNALYLKETLMILIITYIFYNAIKLVKIRESSLLSYFICFTGIIALFYFRTAIAVLVLLSLLFYFIANISFSKKNGLAILIMAVLLLSGIYSITHKMDQIEELTKQYELLENGDANIISQKLSMKKNVNILTSLAIPLVMVNTIIAPYPSFLNIDDRQIGVISHSQNEVIRILLFYFAIIGYVYLIKNSMRKSLLLLLFISGHLVLLGLTGAAYFDRFQLPALPFIIILLSVGIIDSSKKAFLNWNNYIYLIWIAAIAWQIFKLKIRGL
jgi:hypothetical protein